MANPNADVTTLALVAPKPTRKTVDKKKSKAKAKGKVLVEDRDIHHMSPFFNTLIPTVINQGRAFPYTGLSRIDFTQLVGDTILIAATNVGIAGTVFTTITQNGAGAPFYQVWTIPTIALADNAGGPTSGRAMKVSLGLVNTTPLLNRGGRVTTLNGQSRLRIDNPPSAASLVTFNNIISTIRAMPNTQMHDAAHFGEERHMTGSVVDSVTYEDYEEWVGTESVDEFWEHIAVWPLSTRRDRPMSTMWMILSPPALQQTYTVSTKASFYTRWGLSTVPGQSQYDVPTAPASFINRLQSHAAVMADTIHTIADIGAQAAQYLPAMINAAEYVAPRAMLAIAAA